MHNLKLKIAAAVLVTAAPVTWAADKPGNNAQNNNSAFFITHLKSDETKMSGCLDRRRSY